MNFKNFYEDYWEHRENIGMTKKGVYLPARLKEVVSMIPQAKRKISILDVGCGDGTLGNLLREKINDTYIVGCDISEKSVELSRPFYDKVYQINIEEDNLKEKIEKNGFDYIICVEVLEHLMYPEVILKKSKELLSKEGHIIVSFPNIAWWKYRFELIQGHFPEESRFYHPAEHLHNFTMHTFTKLLSDAGLAPIETGGEFKPPSFMKLIRPKSLTEKFIRKFPNLFGYQIVIKTKMI